MSTIEQSPPTAGHELSFGEKAVGLTFNPGNHSEVETIKRMFANSIEYMNSLRNQTDNVEKKRMLSVAITEAQTSQMWAVKAVTWQY